MLAYKAPAVDISQTTSPTTLGRVTHTLVFLGRWGDFAALPFAGLLLPWTTSFWAEGGILDLGLESDLSDPVLVLPPLAPNRSPVEKIGHDQEDGG